MTNICLTITKPQEVEQRGWTEILILNPSAANSAVESRLSGGRLRGRRQCFDVDPHPGRFGSGYDPLRVGFYREADNFGGLDQEECLLEDQLVRLARRKAILRPVQRDAHLYVHDGH